MTQYWETIQVPYKNALDCKKYIEIHWEWEEILVLKVYDNDTWKCYL